MGSLIVASVVASVVLTLVLNVVIRAFPGTSADARARQAFGEDVGRPDELPPPDAHPKLRVYFPWKQMLLWSMALTVVLNIARFFS